MRVAGNLMSEHRLDEEDRSGGDVPMIVHRRRRKVSILYQPRVLSAWINVKHDLRR